MVNFVPRWRVLGSVDERRDGKSLEGATVLVDDGEMEDG